MSTAMLRSPGANQPYRMKRASSPSDVLLSEVLGLDPLSRFFSHIDPDINVLRSEKGYEVEVPVAGFKPENVEILVKAITVNEQVITISGKSDRRAFTRTLRLPEDINAEEIEAQIEDGLLTLTLPRYPEAQPRKVSIAVKTSKEG